MLETHQLVSGADPEVALYDGIAFYESGDIHNALSCWKELLRLVPEHEVAQRYVEFVQGYLGLGEHASEQEVSAAQRREANKLRGDQVAEVIDAPVAQATQAFDPSNLPESVGQSAEEPPPPESIRIRRGGASATGTHMAAGFMLDQEESAEDLIEEEMVTKQPHEVLPETLLASPADLADAQSKLKAIEPSTKPSAKFAETSQIAKEAVSGDAGPKTQADGLTVQALSRQLADYHRSGKYEEAVSTAKQLLTQDPKHAVARRYIDEYHRQKQAALQAALRKQKATPAVETKIQTPQSSASSVPSVEELVAESAPTTAPSQQNAVEEPSADVITDFSHKPSVKMQPDQISWSAFDHRAGFFISQVDGNTSYEDLIVISAMPREQAVGILSQLVKNGMIG